MAFLLCDPGWCVHILYREVVKSDVQNKWDDNKQTKVKLFGVLPVFQNLNCKLRGRLFDVLSIYISCPLPPKPGFGV